MLTDKIRRVTHILFTLMVLAVVLPSSAQAACSSPAGNAGNIFYSSTSGIMVYCNGTNWIAMGSSSTTSFGTLATNNFCTATSGTAIACTTASTGSGNVVLSAAPTLSGTVAGVSSTWTTSVAIGTSTLSGALNVNGTATATTFSGSGASLTGIGTSSLSATGTANATTYLRGDNTWGAIATGLTVASTTIASGSTTRILYDNAGVLGEYVISGTGNVVMSASPTFTGTISRASETSTGTTSFQFATDYSTATATQSDVAINTSSAIRYTGAGSTTFYGIVAGSAGQILYLTNAATSTNTLTLANQSASEATAANKIITGTGADIVMANNSSVVLQYDNTASRWRVIGGSGGGIPAGTTGQVQFNSGSSTFNADAKLTWDNTNKILSAGTGAATPVGTTGTMAGITVNLIPQAMSFSSLGGASGAVTVNTGATGQMSYYSSTNVISGTANLYVAGSNIGIGTSAATNLLSLDGQSARTIGLQRDYTAATVGQSLTIQSGGAASGGTNLNGGNLVLTSGVSTGTGTSSIQFQTSPGSAGSTTDNTVATVMTITGAGFVGIGTPTPGAMLDVNGGGTGGYGGISVGVGGGMWLNGNLRMNGGGAYNVGAISAPTNGAGSILFTSGSTQNLVLASNGNVGIGTTSPGNRLQVYPASATAYGTGGTYAAKFLSYGNSLKGVNIGYDDTIDAGVISVEYGGQPWKNLILNGPGGNVGIGSANPQAPLHVDTGGGAHGIFVGQGTSPAGSQLLMLSMPAGYPYYVFEIPKNGSDVYYIDQNGNEYATSNNAISDARLKMNVKPIVDTGGLAAIAKLNPVIFNWKEPEQRGQGPQLGFIAQEVQRALPELITKGAATKLTPDGTLSLNYSGLTAPIVKAIQELKSLFDTDHTQVVADHDALTNLKVANDNEAAEIKELRAEIERLKAAHY